MRVREALAAVSTRSRNVFYGYWFVPAVVVVAFGAAAVGLLELDRRFSTSRFDIFFGGDADAARGILSTIATAFATIAGVVFSITIVTLQLVSSQYTPRALRGFLKDRLNQITAGAFVGIFVYCLLVLRKIRSSGDDGGLDFVPPVSVTTAIALGIAGLVLLLAFVHHVSDTVQVSTIANRVGRTALGSVDEIYPQPLGEPVREDPERLLEEWRRSGEPALVYPERPGYVQAVDRRQLVRDVHEAARLELRVIPGQFVTERTALAAVWANGAPEDETAARVRSAIVVADERDTRQDVGFALRQLADIAIRALSPSINDPTTAITCIGYLRAATERLAARALPREVRRPGGDVVAVASRPDFADFVEEGLGDVARHAARDPRVARALLSSLDAVAAAADEAGAAERAEHVRAIARELAADAD